MYAYEIWQSMESFFLLENDNAQDALTSGFGQASNEVIVIHFSSRKRLLFDEMKGMC